MPGCDHCLLVFPDRDAVYEEIDGQRKVFCCSGCHGIYLLIHHEGLDAFYEKRQWKDYGVSASLLKKEIDIRPFAEHIRDAGQEKTIDLYIDGIRCASCVWLNEKILSKTEGVDYARVNYATHRAKIKWDPEVTGLGNILKRIISIGYNPKPYSESEQFAAQRAETRDLLIRFGTAGFLSSQLMIYSIALYAGYFQGIDPETKLILEIIAMFLTIPVIFYAGMPFLRSTLNGLRHLRFNMDSLITIGAGSAFIYSVYAIFTGGEVYFDTSAMIITLVLLGRYIEATAKGRASETIERLAELTPKTATVIVRDSQSDAEVRETVPVSFLKKGDMVEVKPGEKIPVDGVVVEGESEIDESLLTGESRPVHKRTCAEVVGGSMNLYGAFVFEVTRTGKETMLAGIIRAVEDAQSRRPKIQTVADRVVGIFVPAILLITILTVLYYFMKGATVQAALMTGISVLVIACPCSLGLATPLAVLIFTTCASSRGVLVRSGEVIENASRLSRVLFDKTGTITIGRPVLKKTMPVDCAFDREYIGELAASVESHSEHSIGHAISSAAAHPYKVEAFRAIPGRGVEGVVTGKRIFIGNRKLMYDNNVSEESIDACQEMIQEFEDEGDTVVFLGWDGKVRAFLVISDILRDEAPEVVREIKEMQLEVSLVSGDDRRTTLSIAERVGITEAIPEMTPVRKREVISGMQEKGRRVMMVGDGINDAPALTESAVGVAMGRGTDIALESADAVLVRNDLNLIPYFIKLSRRTFTIIKQNLFWAFFYNIVAVPLAVAGALHPIVAAGAMAASSLFVVGNSLRIRRGF